MNIFAGLHQFNVPFVFNFLESNLNKIEDEYRDEEGDEPNYDYLIEKFNNEIQ